jgi:uncharacterized membrane protein YqiK
MLAFMSALVSISVLALALITILEEFRGIGKFTARGGDGDRRSSCRATRFAELAVAAFLRSANLKPPRAALLRRAAGESP